IGNRQIYQLRKETIERIFGTAKEQHGFRYTQYVGKARMEMKAWLTFACMNLKKLAKILEKRGWNTARFLLILKKIKRKEVLKEKMVLGIIPNTIFLLKLLFFFISSV
ncbi:transposase, partial [Lacrimispora saccharolytica]|nr:transposase [Lacrimispora saccharolytica]